MVQVITNEKLEKVGKAKLGCCKLIKIWERILVRDLGKTKRILTKTRPLCEQEPVKLKESGSKNKWTI